MDVPVAENDSSDNGRKISIKERKAVLARRYVTKNAPKIEALAKLIVSGDKSTFADYETLIGPVPTE